MPIVVNLDVMMAKRKMSLNELSARVDITLANLSILKNNHAKAVRFTKLEAICKALDCQPGDRLDYVPESAEHPYGWPLAVCFFVIFKKILLKFDNNKLTNNPSCAILRDRQE